MKLLYTLAIGLCTLTSCDKGGSDPQPTTTTPPPTTTPGVASGQPTSITVRVLNRVRETTTGGTIVGLEPFAKNGTYSGKSGFAYIGTADLNATYTHFKKGDKVYVSLFYSKEDAPTFSRPSGAENLEAKVYQQGVEAPLGSLRLDQAAFSKPGQQFTDADGSKYVYSEIEITL